MARDHQSVQPSVSIQSEVGWTLHAGVQGGLVVGFLAVIPEWSVPEHTFSMIWFSPRGDGRWAWEGIRGASQGQAALLIESRYGGAALFNSPQIRSEAEALNGPGGASSSGVTFTPMTNGLDADDPFQALVPNLDAPVMEALVATAAAGAVSLSAAVVDDGGTCGNNTVAWSPQPGVTSFDLRLTGVAARTERTWPEAMNPDAPPDDPQNLWFCFPCNYCEKSFSTACGPGVPAVNFDCRYTCVESTTTACAYIDACCVVWPATITITTKTSTELRNALADGTCL